MSASQNLNLDGSDTTTLAEHGTLIEGYVREIMDGQTMTIETLDGQNMANDGQIETMTMGEATVVASGDPLALEEQSMITTAAEEATMVVDVNPLACLLSTFLSADEAVLSASSGTPPKSVPATPLTPRRDFLSAAESTPGAPGISGPGLGGSEVREAGADCDMDVDVGVKRRVVGRRLAVVEDDGETQTSRSTSSVDEDSLMVVSSSKARNKGIKRSRTEKDKDRRKGRRTEDGNSEERK